MNPGPYWNSTAEGEVSHSRARGLGAGWKVSPFIVIASGEERTIADIKSEGAIQQIWMTLARGRWRHTILRIWWDDQERPSVERPIGDFFAGGWEKFAQVLSLAVCVNPGRGFNCYRKMSFHHPLRRPAAGDPSRWHTTDPVCLETDLRVNIQSLARRNDKDRRYLPLQDDIAPLAFWYQTLPTAPFPTLPDREYLEVI